MNSYYITYKFTSTDDPTKGGESATLIQGPPLTPSAFNTILRMLTEQLAKQLGAIKPPAVIITNVIQLENEAGIILPGGGRG